MQIIAYFDILNRLGVTHVCDRQTDGRSLSQQMSHLTTLRHQ